MRAGIGSSDVPYLSDYELGLVADYGAWTVLVLVVAWLLFSTRGRK